MGNANLPGNFSTVKAGSCDYDTCLIWPCQVLMWQTAQKVIQIM